VVDTIPYFDDNYAYLLNSEKEVLLFDCGDGKTIGTYVKKMNIQPRTVCITHTHHDHSGGVDELCNLFPQMKIIPPDYPEVDNLAVDLRVIETPGHTFDHRCYYLPQFHALFTGDTLFAGGCGRCFSGEFELFCDSLGKLSNLPNETRIYPGHEYLQANLSFLKSIGSDYSFYEHRLATETFPSVGISLSEERLYNPFLRAAYEGSCETFIRLRKLKDLY